MKKDTIQSAQSAFAITFTSANPNEYPVIYAEDQWHTANKNDEICTLYDKTHAGNTTSATGAQFTQREVNETLAKAMKNNQNSVSNINTKIDEMKEQINNISAGVVNVYRYKGSVSSLTDLSGVAETSKNGDVYNVRDTGMNYAFIGDQTLHLRDITLRGNELREYADAIYNKEEPKEIKVQDAVCGCTIGATLDNDGNKKIYAIIDTPEQLKRKYVDLNSYDEHLGFYTEVSDNDLYYTVVSSSNMWDALGASKGITLWEE